MQSDVLHGIRHSGRRTNRPFRFGRRFGSISGSTSRHFGSSSRSTRSSIDVETNSVDAPQAPSPAPIVSGGGFEPQILPQFLLVEPIAGARGKNRPGRGSWPEQSDQSLHVQVVLVAAFFGCGFIVAMIICIRVDGCQEGQLAVPVVSKVRLRQGHQGTRRIFFHGKQCGIQDGFEGDRALVTHQKSSIVVTIHIVVVAVVVAAVTGTDGVFRIPKPAGVSSVGPPAATTLGTTTGWIVPCPADQGAFLGEEIGFFRRDQGPIGRTLVVFLEAHEAPTGQAGSPGSDSSFFATTCTSYGSSTTTRIVIVAALNAGGKGGFRVEGFARIVAPRVKGVTVVVVVVVEFTLFLQVRVVRVGVDGVVVPSEVTVTDTRAGTAIAAFLVNVNVNVRTIIRVQQPVDIIDIHVPLLVAGRMLGQRRQTLVQGGKIAIRLQNEPPVVGVGDHGQRRIDRQCRVGHQKGIEEALDQCGVSYVVGKPGQDPGEAKEGFHVGVHQVVVDLRIDLSQQGKQYELESRLQSQKVRPEGVRKVAKGNLAENLGG
mmetsp:Transcript_7349/g.16603  ORF Transcript_7349/g.16603 Transcript_7349/m.16603 type:complete len:541 (+) Transcript_7349:1089-2711(+)